jgi:Cys-tRNA(Pro) deacylase
MDIATPVTRVLDQLGIPYRIFQHPGPIESLEQAARERGQRPSQVVRSIIFRLSEGEYLMVLVAGPEQISWPNLRAYLNQSRISMADPEDVQRATGYVTGAVSPLGLPQPMRILVDRSVLAEEELSLGSGERGVTIILSRENLLRSIGSVEIGDFSRPISPT